MSGIVNVYKPRGWSSFDVVRKIKKIYNTSHVGHLGTLDPMAEGVLTIAVGKATKLFDYYLNKGKEYIATFKAGEETDTLDCEGEIVKKSKNIITKEAVLNILPKFIGEIDQVPPKYSAVKINGRRAYDLARKDIDFEIKPKKVNIYGLELLENSEESFVFKINCSAGTYIRSLGRDIFSALGSCATMTKLIRTRVGNFKVSESKTIEEVEKGSESCLVPLRKVLEDLTSIDLDAKYKKELANGVRIKNITSLSEGQEFLLSAGGSLFGIATISDSTIVLKVNLYEGE